MNKEELFSLIKSLTKQEKIYFRMLVNVREGEKKYLRLFDEIEIQTTYDEKKLREKLKGEAFLKQLPVAKNYLQSIILKSLRAFHSQNNLDNELKDEIRNIEILYDKGLYQHCSKLIKRAYEKADANEKYFSLLEIINWQRRLERVQGYKNSPTVVHLEKTLKEEFRILELIKNLREYDVLSDKYFLRYLEASRAGQNEGNKILKKMLAERLLTEESRPLSYKAKFFFYTINSRLHHNTGDLKKSYDYGTRQIALLEALPEKLFKEENYNYIIALYNHLIILTFLKKNREFEETIRKVRALPATKSREKATLFYTYLTEIDFYISNKRFAEACRLEKQIAEGLETYRSNINKQVETAMIYSLSVAFIGAENYKHSLKWVNKILNHTGLDIRTDFYCMARLLNLIIHYELGNYNLLDSLSRSANRYLKKKEFYGEAEELLLNYFSFKLPEAVSAKEKISALKKLRAELSRIVSDPKAANIVNYFDFKGWIDRKISLF